jgi:hypothetical protein
VATGIFSFTQLNYSTDTGLSLAYAVGGKTTISKALEKKSIVINSVDTTKYRLDIPVVVRGPRLCSTSGIPQAHSPTYSAELDLNTEPIQGQDISDFSNSLMTENNEFIQSTASNDRLLASNSSNSSLTFKSRSSASLQPPNVLIPFVAETQSNMNFNTALVQSHCLDRRNSLGQVVADLIATDLKFIAIKDRLLPHRDVFSDLPTYNVQEIKA